MILMLLACGPIAPTAPVATGQEPPATPDPGGDRVQYHWADDNGTPVTTGPDPIVFGEDGVAWRVRPSRGDYESSLIVYHLSADCSGEPIFPPAEPLVAVPAGGGAFVARSVGADLQVFSVQSYSGAGTCAPYAVQIEGLALASTFDTTPPARTWVGAWHRVPGSPE